MRPEQWALLEPLAPFRAVESAHSTVGRRKRDGALSPSTKIGWGGASTYLTYEMSE